jgi:Holliday junction DNA helicase RuvA
VIAYLEGLIKSRAADHVVVLVNGVGYQIFVTPASIAQLPAAHDAKIQFHIHTHVREDQLTLYGFLTAHELQIFQRLLNVQGIGPKLALTVLAGLAPQDFVSAVVNDDLVRLNAIPGIGKKTAERIVLDLKDRLIKDGMVTLPAIAGSATPSGIKNDVVSALLNLGYNRPDAERVVARLKPKDDASISQLVKDALKEISRA